eukprot:CAMPEP_0201477236 /NCGR_PEP_ID=MMETSP0151_2-20130828/2299_1 /ASSEMBLY_ACC=CAM_ASM_000257 /TAXON_ID=200890 /ORGANISM="Paramoeba atlantica, Strain 621/1 / CCAP 1560/9" /LENGTH=424 /DNA_ID=CAMNT_0047857881 /DNA_START=271 /DNA_END=1546 /DNA_ORIENTATION=+
MSKPSDLGLMGCWGLEVDHRLQAEAQDARKQDVGGLRGIDEHIVLSGSFHGDSLSSQFSNPFLQAQEETNPPPQVDDEGSSNKQQTNTSPANDTVQLGQKIEIDSNDSVNSSALPFIQATEWTDLKTNQKVYIPKTWDKTHSRLVVEVVEAANLRSPSGSECHPFVQIAAPQNRFFKDRTSWMPSTNNPVWRQYFIYDYDEGKTCPPSKIVLDIYSQNYLSKEYLGTMSVDLTAVTDIAADCWFPLAKQDSQEDFGQIHCRIQYRKRFDQTSEAGEELRLINDILSLETKRKEDDLKLMGESEKKISYNAGLRLKNITDKLDTLTNKKRALIEMTLLDKLPMSKFEVDDVPYVLDETEAEQKRNIYIEMIERLKSDLSLHHSFSDAFAKDPVKKKTWTDLREKTELRLEYLLLKQSSLIPFTKK